MMQTQESIQQRNLKTLQEIYAAFGRGDAPAILARVSEDVVWDFRVDHPVAPWQAPVH